MKKIKLSQEEKEIENGLLSGKFKPLKGKRVRKIEDASKPGRKM